MTRNALSCLAVCLFVLGLAACQPQPAVVAVSASPQEYFDGGMRAFSAGDYNQAATQFETAIQMAPGMAQAYWYLGMSYSKMGMTRRAEDTFQRGLAVAPGDVRLHEALGILSYDMGNYPQASRELGQASALGSVNPQVFYYLGNLAMNAGDCSTALANYNRALTLDPGYMPARQELANAQGRCRPRTAAPAPRPKVEKSFTGGGRAIDPSEF